MKIFKKVDRLSENDASSSATRKWLLLTSKSLFLIADTTGAKELPVVSGILCKRRFGVSR